MPISVVHAVKTATGAQNYDVGLVPVARLYYRGASVMLALQCAVHHEPRSMALAKHFLLVLPTVKLTVWIA